MKKLLRKKSAKNQALVSDETNKNVDTNIMENIEILKALFKDCSDIVFRPFLAGRKKAYLLFVDGFINTLAVELNGLRQLLDELQGERITAEILKEKMISISSVNETTELDEVVSNVLKGNTVLLVDGVSKAIIFDSKGGDRRTVSEPTTESVVRGPREGFTEVIRTNTALVRHKIRSNRLKILAREIGEETKTQIAILYVEGLAAPELVKEVLSRLDRIKTDSILESGYIEEFIEDSPWSMFPQIQNTERPDTVAANLLEGRVAIMVDGTPFVLIMPATFWQFFQSSEDYYGRYHIYVFLRLLRVFFLFIALTLPGIYVAVTTYHQEMIPTSLLFSIAASREAIPFPMFVEALIMEVSFEALREAGVRLPQVVGQAVGILGALVIGTAAVEAGIVSAPTVIIVSITGIASFTIPRFNMSISIRMLRFPLMILGAMFGFYGVILGFLLILTHLCKLRSFGIPYFWPLAPISFKSLKDVLIRVPWWAMNRRPDQFVKEDQKRQVDHLMPSPPKMGEGGDPS
ncbi:spore germination protein [Neobacillus thermocopriae]|uniref:Spore germination protein n=1 Tax=Neobacillus thermocopriae TaxID=1215031 RepID=A0A6B3TML2_9BACI|nr:spore germination protein [Neobacillus thermocopriae]MED3624134.1 spore germination protein [Neobacillus thermocopriae]MED3713671.1 spore germination protein [Neobacillus thermocopriae]NEX78184.1 spore germination protein [Neobacillus thermocopriae]